MNTPNLSLAILSTTADANESIAVLSLALESDNHGWQQLLPAGHFQAVDGRPFDVPGNHWFIDASVAEQLIALASVRQNDLVIDYEHQTLKAEENGQPAPAAGWFKEMEWREGSGLWIKPSWTARASEFIRGGEYKYLSAVFPYDKTTGKPIRLHSAGLVNRPGIDGMQAVEALAALAYNPQPQQEQPMNELLKKMLKHIGIDVVDGQEPDEAQVMAALSELVTTAGSAKTLASEVAALKANDNGGAVDPSKYVPIEVVTALHAQMAVLSAEGTTNKLDQTIRDALQSSKLLPAMEEWARDLGKKDIAALEAYLDKAQPIAALGQMQTTHREEKREDAAVLSESDKEVARLLGKTEEEFAALKG
jgi:phage I-like protein